MGSRSRPKPNPKPALDPPGPSAERSEKPSEGKDLPERFSGAVAAFSRRNVSSPGNCSSKEVLVSEKTGNESARAVMSSSRPVSSGELCENRSSKLFSSGIQRIQPGQESKPTARLGREDALRSFDLLSIGSGKWK